MIPSESKLLHLLSNNDVTFFIPPYQRNYEWTDDQCSVFMDDVWKTCDQNISGIKSEHFFGTITYFQTEAVFGQPNKLVLIDGQQRITTTMLFLVALRDVIGDETVKKFIDAKYLKNDNVSGTDVEYKIKLKQVETDWEAYKKIILSDELEDREKNSAVYHNYRYFMNKLTGYQKDGVELSKLVEKGLNSFSVITIQLEPDKNAWENPQEIFESMNSLGKPLSLADLVRNYLLLGLNPDVQDDLYRKYWLHIEKTVPGKVSDLIRDYMQAHERKPFSKSTESNYKDLYGSFKQIFGGSDPEALLKDLSENSTIYAYLVAGENSGSKLVDNELKDLNTLGVTTAYSFLMVFLHAWQDGRVTTQNVVDVLRAFKIYCMRRRIIGLTTAENKNFPLLANRVEDLVSAPDKGRAMFNILSSQENSLRLPNDVELRRYMATMNFANFKHCKFYLSLVEEKITKSRPDLTDKKLQLEHIMPQTPSEEWLSALGEDADSVHQELVNTIGNLTLIRHNQELGNKPFVEKKELYVNNAGLQIAKTMITDKDKWDKQAIVERAEWIINYILMEVMPIPDSMRRTNNFNIKSGKHLSFNELQIIGESIYFIDDHSIVAHVVDDKSVEFEGKKWKLSPLTKEIFKRRGTLSPSGSYQGARYWECDGLRLLDIM